MRVIWIVACLASAVGLTLGIVWALRVADVWTGLVYVAADRWGVVTLADLGVGLVFVIAWMRLLERRTAVWLAWSAGVLALGNLTTAVFLLSRLLRTRDVRSAILGP
jgi:hypothetical protein